METTHILDKNHRYDILPDSCKVFIEKVFNQYCRKKDKQFNIILARCVLMFVCAARFYKGNTVVLNTEILNIHKIEVLLRCCTKSLPEPGTLFAIQLCHLYNQPQQQNKMNIKRSIQDVNYNHQSADIDPILSKMNKWSHLSLLEQLSKLKSIDCYINTPIYSKREYVNKVNTFINSNKNDLLLSSTSVSKICYSSFTITEQTDQNTWTDSEQSIELYKKILKIGLTFSMCIELKEVEYNVLTFITYHEKMTNLDNFITSMGIAFGTDNVILWFTNEHRLFKLPENISNYLRNLEDYLYCRLTDRFKPNAPRTDNDGITKIICSLVSRIVKHVNQRSLKSAGLADAGLNPFAMILNDAALKNLEKFSNSDRGMVNSSYTIDGPFESMLTNAPYTGRYSLNVKSTMSMTNNRT